MNAPLYIHHCEHLVYLAHVSWEGSFLEKTLGTQVTLFPYNCWVSAAKTRFGPVSGVPGPKRVLGNGQNRPKATGRNYAAGPFLQESGKLQWVERAKFRCRRSRLSRFSRGWPQKGHFGPFLGPGGSRADPKTPIWPPRKNRSWK